MPAIGRNTKVTRLDKLTDRQIQQKWEALLPSFIRMLCLGAGVSLAVFLFNHFGQLSQRATDIAVVAFEISMIFTACFACLTGAALFFRSNAWVKKPG